MNFNKNNKRNKEENSRFGGLKTETETNPFKKSSRSSNRSKDRDNSTRKSNSGFGSSQKGSYVPPSQRKKKEQRSRFKDRAEPEKPKIVIPDVHDKELFPSLGGKPTYKKDSLPQETTKVQPELEIKIETKTENETVEKAVTEDVVTNKKEKGGLWSSVVKYQAPDVTEEDPDYIPPGWVRIKYDKETKEFIYTYGPESEEYLEFMAKLKAYKRQKAIEEWDRRLQEYEEEDIFWGRVDNYYYSWQAEEVEAERRLDEKIAQMEWELENGTYWDETPDSDEESDFYEDEY